MSWKNFKTESTLEEEGVWNELHGFRVKLARAGGGNRRYQQALQRKIKPLQRRASSLPIDELKTINRELFAEHCVKGWQTRVGDEWKDGIESPDGPDLLPFNATNVKAVLAAAPDLADMLIGFADDLAQYRQEQLEEAAGNSAQS